MPTGFRAWYPVTGEAIEGLAINYVAVLAIALHQQLYLACNNQVGTSVMSTYLKLEATSIKNLPDVQAVLAEAKALIEDTHSWPEGKTHHGVRTHRKAMMGPSWHSRTSTHGPEDGTFDDFWNCLGITHSLNEKEYVPEVKSATPLGSYDGFEGSSNNMIPINPYHLLSANHPAWTMGYSFTPPVSDRVFTVLIACILEEQPGKQGFVISLPLDVSADQDLKEKEPRGVRGHYVSVERVKEIDGITPLVPSMATRSSPGGLIPTFLSEPAMPSKISEVSSASSCSAKGHVPLEPFLYIQSPNPQDVPHVVEWIKASCSNHTTRSAYNQIILLSDKSDSNPQSSSWSDIPGRKSTHTQYHRVPFHRYKELFFIESGPRGYSPGSMLGFLPYHKATPITVVQVDHTHIGVSEDRDTSYQDVAMGAVTHLPAWKQLLALTLCISKLHDFHTCTTRAVVRRCIHRAVRYTTCRLLEPLTPIHSMKLALEIRPGPADEEGWRPEMRYAEPGCHRGCAIERAGWAAKPGCMRVGLWTGGTHRKTGKRVSDAASNSELAGCDMNRKEVEAQAPNHGITNEKQIQYMEE
ncbi:hypothetical protein AG1IA_08622 [Rhizoctonia solani AG-1 IA]|uniref:DUF3074 domain-containing protein n=1 Tax=Thanatephorus cucumeris (strain AG1-IA) TaxID=983506 RepID=L8WLZ5_THACA|nr:hypothetical protein AG1IA_08622 [Rhizoctonia solani AG-1 IA]